MLIAKGELVFPVKAGDTLDGVYKVESVSAERIELVYLPLGTPNHIVVSSALDAERAQPPRAAAPDPRARRRPRRAPGRAPGPPSCAGKGRITCVAGESFSVTLRVSTSEPLRAAPMQLRFAPDVLQPVNVQPGKFFGQGSFSYRVNPEGSIFVGASSPAAAAGDDAELVDRYLPADQERHHRRAQHGCAQPPGHLGPRDRARGARRLPHPDPVAYFGVGGFAVAAFGVAPGFAPGPAAGFVPGAAGGAKTNCHSEYFALPSNEASRTREAGGLERCVLRQAVDAGEAAVGRLDQAPLILAGDRVGIEPAQVAHACRAGADP